MALNHNDGNEPVRMDHRTTLIVSILLVAFELMLGMDTENMGRISATAMAALRHLIPITTPDTDKNRRISRNIDDDGVMEAEYALPRIAAAFRSKARWDGPIDMTRVFGWMNLNVNKLSQDDIAPPDFGASWQESSYVYVCPMNPF